MELKLPFRSQLQRYSFLSGIPGYPVPIGIISSRSSEPISASYGIFGGILNINIKHVTTNPPEMSQTDGPLSSRVGPGISNGPNGDPLKILGFCKNFIWSFTDHRTDLIG